MEEKETTINIAEAVASFFIPGLGQLIQERPFIALVHFLLAVTLWFTIMFLGWIVHVWSAFDAARYKIVDEKQE